MVEIFSRYRSEDIRRRDDSLSVWDIGRPGLFARHRRHRREVVAACRQELLTRLIRSDRPVFLMTQAPPREYEVPGNWQPAAKATWLVPGDLNLDHPIVKHWLFTLGDWRLYSAPGPAQSKWPDAFRCSAAELVAWMSAQAVAALIESFHDDTDWVVAFTTPEPGAAPDRRAT
jgi:hypothetical protein